MFYDAGCDFCLKSCHILRTLLMLPEANIRTAQSDADALQRRDAEFSWVVRTDGEDATKSAALTALICCSPMFFWLGPVFRFAEPVGNVVYGFVARQRGLFARGSAGLMPWRSEFSMPGRYAKFTAGFFVLYLGWWNLATIPNWSVPWGGTSSFTVPFPKVLAPVKDVLRLDQHWSMFAPAPATDDGWFLWPGVTQRGTLVNARTGP